MHILMLISQFPPEVRGGAEMQCWRQARFSEARPRVTVLTAGRPLGRHGGRCVMACGLGDWVSSAVDGGGDSSNKN